MTITIPPLVSLQERFDTLLKESAIQAQQLAILRELVEQLAQEHAFEEQGTGLVLIDGTRAPRENPEVIVSISINGKGVRTRTVFSKASIEDHGWGPALAQACEAPMVLLMSKLEGK